MRHVFILNPAAGKNQRALKLRDGIRAAFAGADAEPYAIEVTTAPGDAQKIAEREVAKGDPVRLYACGGDGTMMETASGMLGASHAELACVPVGSANDFVRAFRDTAAFLDLPRLIRGTAVAMDAINCNGELSLNLCSMGMDADVAYRMKYFKRLPLVSGSAAYGLAVFVTFFHKIGRSLRVVMETVDETGRHTIERTGNFLFALAANGQYYGGGYHGAPKAVLNDGLLDFVLIRAIGHAAIPAFLKRYKAGEHLDMDICETFRGTSMKVYAATPTVVNIDGECSTATETEFQLLPQAVKFVLPERLHRHPSVLTEVTV